MPVLETMSVPAAAQQLQVNRDTVYEAIRDGRLRAVDCDGKTRVLKDDVTDFERRGPGRPTRRPPKCVNEFPSGCFDVCVRPSQKWEDLSTFHQGHRMVARPEAFSHGLDLRFQDVVLTMTGRWIADATVAGKAAWEVVTPDEEFLLVARMIPESYWEFDQQLAANPALRARLGL